MKQSSILIPILIALFSLQTQAQIIFNHTFNEGTGSLNGTAVDTGTGSWVAGETVVAEVATGVVNANGAFSTDSGSATLAWTPSQGTQYQLDASITDVGGDTNWVAVGFANGTSSAIGTGSRFTSQGGVSVEGRAWMMMRGTNTTGFNKVFTEGSSGSSTDWAGPPSLTQADGGDFDVRILLDTTGGAGTWTATWFAKFDAATSFTEVRSSFLLPNEDITSVGFAFSTGAVTGTLSSFTLTQVPEPSVFALIAGLLALGMIARRRVRS